MGLFLHVSRSQVGSCFSVTKTDLIQELVHESIGLTTSRKLSKSTLYVLFYNYNYNFIFSAQMHLKLHRIPL